MVDIGTWNMRGANDAKWRTLVRQYFTDHDGDVLCLQECGAAPATAVAGPPQAAVTNAAGGVFVTPYAWNVGTASRPEMYYFQYYNMPGALPGSRCNLGIVTNQLPTAWWFVQAPYAPAWRPAIGLTLPGGQAVFAVHAISPLGPDAPALVAAVASVAAAHGGPAWYIGGDFNRDPATWAPNPVNISPSASPTYPVGNPVSSYDYVITSNPANDPNTGAVLDVGAASDHLMVAYTNLI